MFEWDGENRLRGVEAVARTNGARKVAFKYDYLGRRFDKVVSEWTGASWSIVYSNAFIYAGWLLVSEECHPAAGNPTTRYYTWGLDFAGRKTGMPGQELGGIGGMLAVTVVDGTNSRTYLPIADLNGNIRAIIEGRDGALAARFEYTAYGALTSETFATEQARADLSGNGLLFQTKYFDRETGLYYFGYRYYDPNSAKWLSRDPQGESGGANLTQFCRNNPIDNVDPLGLEPVLTEHGYVDSYDLHYLGWERAVLGRETVPRGVPGTPVADKAIESLRGESIRMTMGEGVADAINGAVEITPVMIGTAGNLSEATVGGILVFAPEASGLTKIGGGMLIADAVDRQQAMFRLEPTMFEKLCSTYMSPSEVQRANMIKNGGMMVIMLGTAVPGANAPMNARGLIGLVKPGGAVDAGLQGTYVQIANTPEFAAAMARYNKIAAARGLPQSASVEEIVAALRTETTFAQAGNIRAAVFVPGEHSAATRFWLQGNPLTRYGARAGRHELVHLGAALRGQGNTVMHEIAVQAATTPENLAIGVGILGGVPTIIYYGTR